MCSHCLGKKCIHAHIHTITYHYITLHYITLHHITSHYITLHSIHACIHAYIPYHTIQYHTVPYHTILVPYHTIPYHTIIPYMCMCVYIYAIIYIYIPSKEGVLAPAELVEYLPKLCLSLTPGCTSFGFVNSCPKNPRHRARSTWLF